VRKYWFLTQRVAKKTLRPLQISIFIPMQSSIFLQHEAIGKVCARYGISCLEIFESADADFLIEFLPSASPSMDEFFDAKADLEQILGRSVDLIQPSAVRNPYLLASIIRHRELVYAAT
jgi:uncharacterized protein